MLGMAEGGGFGFGEGAEFAGAALDDRGRDLIGKSGRFGTGAGGIGEDVEVGEWALIDEGERGGVVGFGFAGESGDDVGTNGGVGEAIVDELDAAGVVAGAIPAMHGSEDAIRAGLEGHVKVLGDARIGGEEVDEILRDIERFDGADAEALDGGFVEDAAEEIDEFDARSEIAAVGAEVDAGENYFMGWRVYSQDWLFHLCGRVLR